MEYYLNVTLVCEDIKQEASEESHSDNQEARTMTLDKESIVKLKVLGFTGKALPKMKELRKRYLELSLVRHPDKKSGTDEDFQILLNAYL